MSRHHFRREIEKEISEVRAVLEKVPANKRLHTIAEALMDLNHGNITRSSCGCFEWDLSMDYRNAEERDK